jgi:hypothetical protein
MFEMMKMMGAITNVKVVKETRARLAQPSTTALDPDKKPTKARSRSSRKAGLEARRESWS